MAEMQIQRRDQNRQTSIALHPILALLVLSMFPVAGCQMAPMFEKGLHSPTNLEPKIHSEFHFSGSPLPLANIVEFDVDGETVTDDPENEIAFDTLFLGEYMGRFFKQLVIDSDLASKARYVSKPKDGMASQTSAAASGEASLFLRGSVHVASIHVTQPWYYFGSRFVRLAVPASLSLEVKARLESVNGEVLWHDSMVASATLANPEQESEKTGTELRYGMPATVLQASDVYRALIHRCSSELARQLTSSEQLRVAISKWREKRGPTDAPKEAEDMLSYASLTITLTGSKLNWQRSSAGSIDEFCDSDVLPDIGKQYRDGRDHDAIRIMLLSNGHVLKDIKVLAKRKRYEGTETYNDFEYTTEMKIPAGHQRLVVCCDPESCWVSNDGAMEVQPRDIDPLTSPLPWNNVWYHSTYYWNLYRNKTDDVVTQMKGLFSKVIDAGSDENYHLQIHRGHESTTEEIGSMAKAFSNAMMSGGGSNTVSHTFNCRRYQFDWSKKQ